MTGAIHIAGSGDYDWPDWTAVRWGERRKAGWDAVAGAFAAAARQSSSTARISASAAAFSASPQLQSRCRLT